MIDLKAIKARVEKADELRKVSIGEWPLYGGVGDDAVEDRAELVDEVELQRRILQYAKNVVNEKQDSIIRLCQQSVRRSDCYNEAQEELRKLREELKRAIVYKLALDTVPVMIHGTPCNTCGGTDWQCAECLEKIADYDGVMILKRLREELEQHQLSGTTAYMEIEAELHTDELRDEVKRLQAEVERLLIRLAKAEQVARTFVRWQRMPCQDTAHAVAIATREWASIARNGEARKEWEEAAEDALARCGLTGIYDIFDSPADAILQMAGYIEELREKE